MAADAANLIYLKFVPGRGNGLHPVAQRLAGIVDMGRDQRSQGDACTHVPANDGQRFGDKPGQRYQHQHWQRLWQAHSNWGKPARHSQQRPHGCSFRAELR